MIDAWPTIARKTEISPFTASGDRRSRVLNGQVALNHTSLPRRHHAAICRRASARPRNRTKYSYGGGNPLVNIDPEGLTYFCMYSQSSGRFSCFDNDGKGKQVIDDPGCYAGNGPSKNNPADQCKKDQGPLPRGWYDIGSGYNHRLGNPTFKLDPQSGTNMCTPLRDNMRIHADKMSSPGNASDGCIVCSKKTRDQLQRGGGGTLLVTQ